MDIKIVSRWDSDKVLVCGKYASIKEACEKNKPNLLGANLWGANLRGANLWGADLWGANLREANLWGANLLGANLRGANLWGANLRGANLWGANLWGANLRGANLRGADLWGANLREANLWGANLLGANLRGANLWGANLRGANLWGAKNYVTAHPFFQEVIRTQKVETFTTEEWACIGQIIIHTLCWDSIKKRFDKTALSVFEKCSTIGFNEWKKHYKELKDEQRRIKD